MIKTKSIAKYTPGPWEVWTIKNDRMDRIEHYVENAKEEEGHANASLIAAAPELLDACKEALAHFNKYTAGIALDCKDSLRIAIAKAEGI